MIRCILFAAFLSPCISAWADPSEFTDRVADEVLRLCIPAAPKAAHEPHSTCHAALLKRYRDLEPDHADSSQGIIMLSHHELDAWRRAVAAKYARMIAKHAGTDDPFHQRQAKALRSMQVAFPQWVRARCALAGARNGGGYDTLDEAICEAYLTAQHYADLSDPDAVLGCHTCVPGQNEAQP